MSRIVKIIMLLTLAFFMDAFAQQRQNEFAGIAFGSSRETVVEEIMKLGYDAYGTNSSAAERVVIPVFMFGELPVQVDFLFNKNDKFYSFEIRTGRVEQSRISKVFEAVTYMSEQFTLKYGKASHAPEITSEADLKDNLHNIYQEWLGVKTLNSYTALVKKDYRYFALGKVVYRPLVKEAKDKKENKDKKSNTPVF